MRNQWQKARAGANKVFESCNKKMSDGIVAFNEGCKHVWENKYEIALSVAKNIYKNKYEIGADMVAAAGLPQRSPPAERPRWSAAPHMPPIPSAAGLSTKRISRKRNIRTKATKKFIPTANF